MSCYWYLECLTCPAEPPRSSGEVTQHTDDEHYRAAVQLARNQSKPWIPPEDIIGTYFGGNAREFLLDHPGHTIGLVAETGERRTLDSRPTPMPRDDVTFLTELLGEALRGMIDAIKVAGEKTAADAVEYLADWMNGRDAPTEESISAFQRWVDRGRP